jgi:hypothetical protein
MIMNLSRNLFCLAVLLGCGAVATAQSVGLPAPRLLTTMPMGGKAGTTVDVAITGEFLEDTGELVFSDSRITAKRTAENKYSLSIAANCPAGLFEARVNTRLGISSSRIFAVGTLAELVQSKPNRTLATALELPVNSVCNGVVADRAVDFYTVQAKQGQRLIVDCATRGIDSKLNATVIVADAAGRDLLVERRGGALDFTVPKDGTYVIKVHELTFKGGPAFYYRLGVWEQKPGTPVMRQASTQAVNAFSWPPVGLAAQATMTEVEPNDRSKPQRITLPCDLSGRFFPAADTDVFEFDAKKGEEWWIEVASERLGHPTDAAVLVQKVNGATLTDVLELSDVPSPVRVSSNGYAYDGPPYNAGTADVLGKLAVPEDGTYRIQLADLFGGTRSNPNHEYRLIVRKAAPDFALVAWALHMELRNGDRNALSKPLALRGGATMALEVVAFRRDGFNGDIELAMENLPKGVTAGGLKIPAGSSRGMMLVTAAADAPRGYANAAFLGRATVNGKPVERPCHLASFSWPIPDSWGEIPSPRLMKDVPVSVSGLEAAPITIAAKSPMFEVKAGEKLTVPLVHTRASDFNGEKIPMRMIGAGFEGAPGFDLPVQKAGSEVVLDLKALNVPPGEYKVSLLGGGVVKYRHQPQRVTEAEAKSKKMLAEVKTLEAEVKKAADAKTREAVNAKMKSATAALTAAQKQLEQAKQAAQPRDIADIIVCEPFTIRVKPAEKK